MRNLVLGTLVAVAAVAATTPATAQIRGGVFIGGGPVRGAVVIGGGPRYIPRPYYAAPRPIIVDPWVGPPVYGYDGYAPQRMWWDGRNYYDRYYDYPGIREVTVYGRGGRYYRGWDDDRRWDNRRFEGRGGYGRGWDRGHEHFEGRGGERNEGRGRGRW